MELQEKITALAVENKQYKDFLENTNAEKIALDQLLVESLKNTLSAKKELILNDVLIKSLNDKISILNKEKEVLESRILELKEEINETEIS